MLCREVRATKYVATLLSMGIKEANDLTLEEACRGYERARRGARASGPAMPLSVLVANSTKRRRARQTHPGKRGRR